MTKRKLFMNARITLSTLLMSVSAILSGGASAQAPSHQPQGWTYGLGVAASQDVYTGFDNRIVPIPIIGYVGERLRVYGPFVGYQLFQENGLTIDAQLVPIFAGYDQDDSPVFEGMEDRDFSYGAGASISYATEGWIYSVSANADILNTFDGYQASARVAKQFRYKGVIIEPSVGLNYQDSNYVDYYYGVTAQEATAARAFYQADSALNTELRLGFTTRQFLGGMTRLDFGATFFDDSISDSPITDDDMALSAMLTYVRFF
jgi:outer membrane protein